MKRIFAALALTGVLGACASGNGGSYSNGEDVLRSSDAAGIGFNAAMSEVVTDGRGLDRGMGSARKTFAADGYPQLGGGSFDAFTASSGSTRYYALFRRSEAGDAAQKSYQFNGEYAAVRSIVDDTADTVMQYVSGTMHLDADARDLDVRAEVSGHNQEYVSLTRGGGHSDDRAIISSSGSAAIPAMGHSVDLDGALGSRQIISDDWPDVFAGPNGAEVAGVLLVEGQGAVGIDETTGQTIILTADTVQQVGTFVTRR